jgi:hypothetical protein
VSERPTRVGDLIKAKGVSRDDVEAAISSLFDGKTTRSLGERVYALVLPDLAKMTPFAREAIMSAVIEVGAVKW